MKTWKQLHTEAPELGLVEGCSKEYRQRQERHNEEYFLRYAIDNSTTLMVSYPRSGRTWPSRLLSALLGIKVAGIVHDNSGYCIGKNISTEHYISQQNWHLFRKAMNTHLSLIYIIRDPRDVYLSQLYHQLWLENSILTLERCQHMAGIVISQWPSHIDLYRDYEKLVVQYEAMCLHPEIQIESILAYMDIEPITTREEAIWKNDIAVTYSYKPIQGGLVPRRHEAYTGYVTPEERFRDHCCRWKTCPIDITEFTDRIWHELKDIMLQCGYGKDGYDEAG